MTFPVHRFTSTLSFEFKMYVSCATPGRMSSRSSHTATLKRHVLELCSKDNTWKEIAIFWLILFDPQIGGLSGHFLLFHFFFLLRHEFCKNLFPGNFIMFDSEF